MSFESDEYLEHFGVKGMKWGVRKNRDAAPVVSKSSPADQTEKRKLTRNQKMAIIGGAVAAGVIVVGSIYVAKNGNLPLGDLAKAFSTREKGKTVLKKMEKLPADPTQILYVARPRVMDYEWIQGAKEPRGLSIMEEGLKKAGVLDDYGATDEIEGFAKFGKNGQVIAARFLDPEGRKDFSGRPQIHDLIIPASQSQGITSLDDVKRIAWPALAGTYQKVYDGTAKVADHELKIEPPKVNTKNATPFDRNAWVANTTNTSKQIKDMVDKANSDRVRIDEINQANNDQIRRMLGL